MSVNDSISSLISYFIDNSQQADTEWLGWSDRAAIGACYQLKTGIDWRHCTCHFVMGKGPQFPLAFSEKRFDTKHCDLQFNFGCDVSTMYICSKFSLINHMQILNCNMIRCWTLHFKHHIHVGLLDIIMNPVNAFINPHPEGKKRRSTFFFFCNGSFYLLIGCDEIISLLWYFDQC